MASDVVKNAVFFTIYIIIAMNLFNTWLMYLYTPLVYHEVFLETFDYIYVYIYIYILLKLHFVEHCFLFILL